MSDETMIATVAAVLTAGTSDGLNDLGRAALSRLTRSVHARSSVDTGTAAALANARSRPSSMDRRRDLCTALSAAMADTPALAYDVHLLWRHMQPVHHADGRGRNLSTVGNRPTIPLTRIHCEFPGSRGHLDPPPDQEPKGGAQPDARPWACTYSQIP